MAIRYFKTRAEADMVVDGMAGWLIEVIELEHGFVVRCNSKMFLCTDGYVR